MKGVGIQVVQGRGRFTGPNTLQVEGGEEVRFKSAVIATGSRPSEPPIPGLDDPRCLDSTGCSRSTTCRSAWWCSVAA